MSIFSKHKKGPSTIVVAASDTKDKSRADFICTGVNDQDFINGTVFPALPAGGGKVILLEGTYNISTANTPILFPINNISLVGSGKGTLIQTNGAASTIIQTNVKLNPEVSNMRLVSTDGGNFFGIASSGPTGLFNNLHITTNQNEYALSISNAHIANCYVNSPYPLALGSYSTCTGCHFVGSAYGPSIVGEMISFTGNFIRAAGSMTVGIIVNGYNNSVCSNTVYGSAGNGIDVGSNQSSVCGNTIYSPNKHGINLIGSENTVTGNNIYNLSATNNNIYDAIYVSGDKNLVTGNNFQSGVTKYFIELTTAADSNIIKNNLFGCTIGTGVVSDSGTSNTYWDNLSDVMTIGTASDADYYTHDQALDAATPFNCTLITQYPDVPRNVRLEFTDATKYLTNVRVSVSGIDNLGENKTEQFAWGTFSSLAATGNRAFMKINSITVHNVQPYMPDNAILNVGLTAVGGRLKLGVSGRATAYTPDFIYVRKNGTDYAAPAFNATYMTLAPSTPIATDQYEVQFRKNANYWTV